MNVDIVHITSGEIKSLPHIETLGPRVHLRWPFRDDCRFSTKTGGGLGSFCDWKLAPSAFDALKLPSPKSLPSREAKYREMVRLARGNE